ncbi:MAG TPA: hypothetical protein VMZ52_10190 [Bryobacteraceae bacterium]|nr:hypothetical protein [Bryobacteraceae bacterium]
MRNTRTTVTSLAALGSAFAASSCCLPLFPFLFAAGAAGSSTLFTALRPYLLGLSVLLVVYGFIEAWRAKQCRSKPGVASTVLLGLAALFVITSIVFPDVLANATANLMAR